MFTHYQKQQCNKLSHLATLCSLPQHIYWIVTGKTAPEIGQISPRDSENKSLKDTISDILESIAISHTELSPDETAELIMEKIIPDRDKKKPNDTKKILKTT